MTQPCVLLTKPLAQAQPLANCLQDIGVQVRHSPLLKITPVAVDDALFAQWSQHTAFIFTSPNAVSYSLGHYDLHLPENGFVACVGPATAAALQAYGVRIDVMPHENYGSEALWELLQTRTWQQQAVMLICGENSRPLLTQALTKQGAQVAVCACYRRERIAAPELSLDVDAMICTSAETLTILAELLVEKNLLHGFRLPLIVSSMRLHDLAKSLHFEDINVANDASNLALTEAVKHHFSLA